jgi:hypothetical protein
MLLRYQKRQDKLIIHLISTKIPIERGSKEYIMILEPDLLFIYSCHQNNIGGFYVRRNS